jgi:transposase
MDEIIKLLDENLEYIVHKIVGDTIFINVASNRETVICPYCGNPSSKIHSRYERRFQDLPIQGKKVKVILNNRKMFCNNSDCKHTTFAESYDFLKFKATKTKRLENEIINISMNVSSLTATDFLKKNVADVGKSTICNLLKKRSTSYR